MNSPPYRPLGNKYLILPDTTEGESETIGNVTLSAPPPDPHKRSFEGTVVAKGKSCVELEVGDKAVYGEFSGYEREIDGTKYLVLQENEILMEHLRTPFDEDNCIVAVGHETVHRPPCPQAASTEPEKGEFRICGGCGHAISESEQVAVLCCECYESRGEVIPPKFFEASSEPTHILTITEVQPPTPASTPGICHICGSAAGTPNGTTCLDCIPF